MGGGLGLLAVCDIVIAVQEAQLAFSEVRLGIAPAIISPYVVRKIGALARPDDIVFTAELPKTRSGKIMRRLLKDIAEGRALGDTTTLADPAVIQALKQKYQED